MKIKATGSWFMHEECVKDNYYARFHTHSYHCCIEMHFSSRLGVNWQSHWSVKCRSKAARHYACWKSICKSISMQGFILIAITAAEKCTVILDST